MPGSLRILVADDEPDMLELLRVNLEVEGHVVLLASDGNQALSLALSGHPDLIVLDVMMPGMDGLEVLRTLRSQPGGSAMAIVLLSARGSDPEIFEGWQSGANYYITKPFDIQELLDFIEQVEAQPENLAASAATEAAEDPVRVATAVSPVIETDAEDHLELALDLRSALAAHEFFLVYQPSFELRNVSVTGVEALIRWGHPTRGTVQPLDFIPLLEETGLMIEVGGWVLRDACIQAAIWREQGYELTLSVNVSAGQLQSERLVDHVRLALEASGLAAGCLMIDVPETVVTVDLPLAVQQLGAIKELGVRIAIDDFGSDESLTYLKAISVDMLKFDRSFTSGIVESADRAAMMHTLIQVGKSLGLESQAKGIEEQDQFLHLQREGCDTGQGFLFARSLDIDAVGTLLDTWGIKAVAARTPAAAGPVTVLPGFS